MAKNINVLLVEDNMGDVVLVKEALKGVKDKINLSVVENGIEAVDFLRKKTPQYTETPKPDLIILDLNLPIKNGLEVLLEIKKDENLKEIPVAVFTTSQYNKDILKTYDYGGSFFITKPLGYHEFLKSVQSILSALKLSLEEA